MRAGAGYRTNPAAVFTELAWLWAEHDRCLGDDLEATGRRVVSSLRAGGDVLDVGCGPGTLLTKVRRQAREAGKEHGRLVGVDLAAGMVGAAGRRRGVRAGLTDACALPFPDQTFDVVVARHVLHFVDDPVRAVRELCRVTLPGGTLVIELEGAGTHRMIARHAAPRLGARSLLRRYLELPRRYRTAGILGELERQRCEVRDAPGARASASHVRLLVRVARWAGTVRDREVARDLEREGPAGLWRGDDSLTLVARVPGPRTGSMPVYCHGLDDWTSARVKALLAGLPKARGYHVVVKPLRWRTRPHVQAFCEFDHRRITIQVPVPFRPFHEDVPYRAERVGAKGFRFRWYTRRLRFERPDELIRYLYLHEYYHWYLREVVGRQSAAAETACDRFALSHL